MEFALITNVWLSRYYYCTSNKIIYLQTHLLTLWSTLLNNWSSDSSYCVASNSPSKLESKAKIVFLKCKGTVAYDKSVQACTCLPSFWSLNPPAELVVFWPACRFCALQSPLLTLWSSVHLVNLVIFGLALLTS